MTNRWKLLSWPSLGGPGEGNLHRHLVPIHLLLMFAKPGIILRLEGAAIFAVSLLLYHSIGGRWGVFLLLFLWPDISMLGYLANIRLGASLYNFVHTDMWPVALGAYGLITHQPEVLLFAFIWLAHIGMDRMLGYGLKYPTFFKDTHLQRV